MFSQQQPAAVRPAAGQRWRQQRQRPRPPAAEAMPDVARRPQGRVARQGLAIALPAREGWDTAREKRGRGRWESERVTINGSGEN